MNAERLDILFILLCLAAPIGLILAGLCAWLERNRPMATRLPRAERRPDRHIPDEWFGE